jgi:nitrogen fixation NifU-like protein
MIQYNKKVMKYFMKPKNVGKMKNPDGIGKVGNMQCGDIMHVFIKVGEKAKQGKQEIIKEIKFQTLGCPAAIATSSVVTELAKNKTIEKAMKITNKDVIKKLGTLPPIKYHCSLLAEEALSEAIYDYLKKHNKKIPKKIELKHKKILKIGKKFKQKFRKS